MLSLGSRCFAGLAAARQLVAFGYRVIIVEGHGRPGGRVYTKQLKACLPLAACHHTSADALLVHVPLLISTRLTSPDLHMSYCAQLGICVPVPSLSSICQPTAAGANTIGACNICCCL